MGICGAQASAQEVIFFDGFEEGDTAGWWAPARVGETGQKTCFDESGNPLDCNGTGRDGDRRPGVAWAEPRFTINGDGTVTDELTGLVWLQDASCSDLPGTDSEGNTDWQSALAASVALVEGICGLSDGSAPGDWRLPTVTELQSLIDQEFTEPSVSNAVGTGQWIEGDPFSGIGLGDYWSSTADAREAGKAWAVRMRETKIQTGSMTSLRPVWPVRNRAGGAGWAPARVARTGQMTCRDQTGPVDCEGTGQDGELRPGEAWPVPRFVVNNDGTVTDMLTGLVWLQNSSCWFDIAWQDALVAVSTLTDGTCGLTDGSVTGSWRLPSINELQSLFDYEYESPVLSNSDGTGQHSAGDPFTNVLSYAMYWTSTEARLASNYVLTMNLQSGSQANTYAGFHISYLRTWPVRDGP